MEQKADTLLEIHDLSVSFRMYSGAFEQTDLQVISNLRLTVRQGEIVAVVGSSGSGKSLLASAILGLLPGNAQVNGHLHYNGEELTSEKQKKLRGTQIALVPQSVSYLDPLMKVDAQMYGFGNQKEIKKKKGREIFGRLGLPKETEKLYPFQLSGGMARRVLVSTALLTDARLIIADEPTPGMSLEQSLESLKMFREMANAGKAVVLITHDLDLAVEFADKIAVFYAGTTVETAPACDFQNDGEMLRHPYTKALWRALPQNGFNPIDGFQPYAGNLPKGCLFSPRCPYADEKCRQNIPPIREIRGGEVRCYYGD